MMSKEDIENKICTLTGGRAAEELMFNSITTGASNDIEQATRLAKAMVSRYGMTDEFGMVALETEGNRYLGGGSSADCSPETMREIDKKVVEIVSTQYEKAKKLLKENMHELNSLADFLYRQETITGDEFMDLLKASKNTENTENN